MKNLSKKKRKRNMKNGHPIITAASSSLTNPDSCSSSNEPSSEPIIRLKLDKPLDWEWELTTSADTLPVIQLLDKNGRLLVETSGRTAQRARGSFREGLKSREEFLPRSATLSSSSSSSSVASPCPQGNRNVDGFSSKFGTLQFGYKPRKSRSEISVRERRKRRKDRSEEGKKYSMGDYLRQQIIDDLGREGAKSAEEIARERCRKVKAYLRSRSETLVHEEPADNEGATRGGKIVTSEAIEEEEDARSPLRLADRILKPEGAGKERKGEELERVRSFLRRKIQQRMELERSVGTNDGIEKSNSCYGEAEEPGYRTRKARSEASVIRFDPEIVGKDRRKGGRQVERWSRGDNGSRCRQDSSGQKAYRRSRSETILEGTTTGQGAEKRKLYRKTRSDALVAGQMGGGGARRRQDTVDETWREYKERKRHERSQRRDTEEEDSGRNDVRADLCTFDDCKICQSLKNCASPARQMEKEMRNRRSVGEDEGTIGDRDDCSEVVISPNDSANERPASSSRVREKYLVDNEVDASPKNHVLVKVRAKNREADSSNVNSPDCGYNTIPKKAFNDYKELYARSNVKKSDTFKIVDGSEGIEEGVEEEEEEGDGSIESFDYSNGEGVLMNKSNEDIARDYFKRVYELLRKRQREARRVAEKQEVAGRDDSSSSNYAEKVEKRRPRRKKKERGTQGKKREL